MAGAILTPMKATMILAAAVSLAICAAKADWVPPTPPTLQPGPQPSNGTSLTEWLEHNEAKSSVPAATDIPPRAGDPPSGGWQLDDVKEDRNRWRAQAERLALPAPSNVSHENLCLGRGGAG